MDIYNEIQLEFTIENLRKVFSWGATPENAPHSHQAIASWCERFWNKYCDIDAPEEIKKVMPVLADVECQWDMYFADYSTKHQDSVKKPPCMPVKWFSKWMGQISS